MALGWQFARYINPILAALGELGGSARPGEVYDWVAEHCGVSDSERSIKNKSGDSRFENQVAWARFYSSGAGILSHRSVASGLSPSRPGLPVPLQMSKSTSCCEKSILL